MAKMIAFDQEAQDKIRSGVSKLAKAVRVTLGPRGRNVILQKSFGSPTVTKDGVTVAREIELGDKFEDMGARMVKEVASKTSDVAGDGTTTATIMAEAIYIEGLRAVVSGVNPVEMKRGMDKAVEDIVAKLKGMSIECRNKKSIGYVENCAAFLEYVLRYESGNHTFNYVDKPDFDMNTLVPLLRSMLGKRASSFRLPYWLGYAVGMACDVVARVTRKKLPVSAVRVKKFCGSTQFSSRKAMETGFVPPVTIQEGLKRTIQAEFLGGGENISIADSPPTQNEETCLR